MTGPKAELGIFARTNTREEQRDELDLVHIGRAFADQGLSIRAVSDMFNLIHPDRRRRSDDFAAAASLIRRAGELGTSFVTSCTGTCDPVDRWRRHPDNDSPELASAASSRGSRPARRSVQAGGSR